MDLHIIPEFLYHGRKDLVDIIPLEQAFDSKGQIDKNLFEVYASDSKTYSAFFAIWPQAKYGEPHPSPGYLYLVKSDQFRYIGDSEYISLEPVKPVSYEVVLPEFIVS